MKKKIQMKKSLSRLKMKKVTSMNMQKRRMKNLIKKLSPFAQEEIQKCMIMIVSGKLKTHEAYVMTEYVNSLLRMEVRENDPRR